METLSSATTCRKTSPRMALATADFTSLSTEFANLTYNRKNKDRLLASKILDDLNDLDFGCVVVYKPTIAVLLMNNCCSFVAPDDEELVAKCSLLFLNLIKKQQVIIEGGTLILIIKWCLETLKVTPSQTVLQALDVIIRNHLQNVQSFITDVLAENSPLIQIAISNTDPELILLAVQCLEGICWMEKDKKKNIQEKRNWHFNICYKIFVDYIMLPRKSTFDIILHIKLLTICARGLQNIINLNTDYLQSDIGLLLGIVKTYMVYGIKGVEFISPSTVVPTVLEIPEPSKLTIPRENKGGKVYRQRKHKVSCGRVIDAIKKCRDWRENTVDAESQEIRNTQIGTRPVMSDSDMSDCEMNRPEKIALLEARLRQQTLNLLFDVAQLVKKSTLFSFWLNFIIENSSLGSHYLTTCILKDPSPKCRLAALNVLLVFLTESKLYLLQAEMSGKTSFTPFSVTLGYSIKELHKCLCFALNENSLPVLIQVLKCLAALIQATPYNRLEHGLVSKIVRNVKGFLKHKDVSVQVGSLIVFGTLLSTDIIQEAREIFQNSKFPVTHFKDSQGNNSNMGGDCAFVDFSSSSEDEATCDADTIEMPWLLVSLLRNLGASISEKETQKHTPMPIKIESAHTMSVACRNYFDVLFAPYLGHITKALEISLTTDFIDLKLHAARAVDSIGQELNKLFEKKDNSVSVDGCLVFWQSLLNGPLISLIQEGDQAILREAGCNALSSIGVHLYERLTNDRQLLIVTLLVGCAKDEDDTVAIAAVQALSQIVAYPSLNEDIGFILDTADAICRILKKETTFIKIKGTWALSNLSDALLTVKRKTTINSEEINVKFILHVLKVAVENTLNPAGDEQIRMHAIRATGNFLQLFTNDAMIDPQIVVAVEEAVVALINYASKGKHMKTKWNSCYALGNVLKTPALFTNEANFQAKIFSTLMDLLENCANFKVRISAALALTSPPSKRIYGEFYIPLWNTFLRTLENCQNIDDFSEYKHRDNLIDQICLGLGKLFTFMDEDDVNIINENIEFYFDTLQKEMHRVLERVVPEKASVLVAAAVHLNTLLPKVKKDQEEILKQLTSLLSIST